MVLYHIAKRLQNSQDVVKFVKSNRKEQEIAILSTKGKAYLFPQEEEYMRGTKSKWHAIHIVLQQYNIVQVAFLNRF